MDLFEVLPYMLLHNIILQGNRDEPRLETKPVSITLWALNDGDLLRIKKAVSFVIICRDYSILMASIDIFMD